MQSPVLLSSELVIASLKLHTETWFLTPNHQRKVVFAFSLAGGRL